MFHYVFSKIITYTPNKTLGFGELATESILSSNIIKTENITMQDWILILLKKKMSEILFFFLKSFFNWGFRIFCILSLHNN